MCVLVAGPPAAARAGPVPQGGRAYLALVDQYQRGECDAAVVAFLAWQPEELRGVNPVGLVENLSLKRQRAVVMLHTEALIRGGSTDALLPAARRAVSALDTRDEKDDADFLVLWRVLTASSLLWTGGVAEAHQIIKWRHPDVRLELAGGSVYEFDATDRWSAMAPLTQKEVVGRERRSANPRMRQSPRHLLMAAEVRYRRVIKEQPGLVEARLRLGRMLAILDRPAEARVELERAFQEAPPGFLRYMAAMFLGALDERGGRPDAAKQRYTEALAEYPAAQTAHLALGHLLESQGRTEEGWAEVRKAFVNQSDRDASARDPWLVYRLAQFWQRDAIVERLREAVRR